MSEEILAFDIVIEAKLGPETKKSLEELKAAKEDAGRTDDKDKEEDKKPAKDTTPKLDAEKLLESEGELNATQLKQIKATVGESLGGLDKAGIEKVGSMAKNPGSFVTKSLTQLLGSGAPAIMGPLAIAIAAPVVMVEVIKALSVKGGPFNRDWRRFIQDEVEVGLSRVQQKEKELGISQTILTQIEGFKPNNENFTYNSLFDVNDSRLARVGLSDSAAGVTVFIP